MRVDQVGPKHGAKKSRKRVGRGIGGKGGKTAGRGTKGQYARNTVARGFEGGQMPLKQRVPKLKGFNNPFRVEYQAINLGEVERIDRVEIHGVVLHAERVVEALQLRHALLERHLAAFEAARDGVACVLTLGTATGGLAAFTADTTTDSLG